MVSIRRDTFPWALVIEAGIWELIRSSPKFPLSTDSSSAWLCERLTVSAANSYRWSNRIIGLPHIHLLLFPLPLMIGVEGKIEGRINPTQSWTDRVVLQNKPGATFKSLSQTANKIHLHRAHFCYVNQCIFYLAFPFPFCKPTFRYNPLTSCVPVSFTIIVIYVDRVSFLTEVLWR